MQESRASICRISSTAHVADDPVLAAYSAFKLGLRPAIEHYARLLLPALRRHTAPAPAGGPWVLTAPPYAEMPTAANRLCWRLHAALTGGSVPVEQRDLRKPPDVVTFPGGHYAGLDEAARQGCLARSYRSWHRDEALRGRAVIVVDDIRATGSQEAMLRSFLTEVGAARVHWQYLVEIPGTADAPLVERELNGSTIATVDDFRAALDRADRNVCVTSKLLWWLFALDLPDFRTAVTALRPEHRHEALRLVRLEVRRIDELQPARLAVLKSLVCCP